LWGIYRQFFGLGQLKDGSIRHGYGSQCWPDGSRYEGVFFFIFFLLGIGEWKGNKAHGFGELRHTDGDMYRGDWEVDKANGQGTYVHANGTTYYVF
jgi:hypothetical protein